MVHSDYRTRGFDKMEENTRKTTNARQHKLSLTNENRSSTGANRSRLSTTMYNESNSKESSPLASTLKTAKGLAAVAPLLTEANQELLDNLVADYYCADYRSHPQAAHEQRKSRRRGLPSFVSEVFHCSQDWTSWERDGLYNELVKATETVLCLEAEAARASLGDVFQSVLAARDSSSSVCNEELMSLKDRLAQEVYREPKPKFEAS